MFVVEKPPALEKYVMKVSKIGRKGTVEFNNNVKSIQTDVSIAMKLASQCKFLVMIKEFFMENEYSCLVLEYCSRGNVARLFEKKKALPEQDVITLTTHIMNALKAIHGSNFIYSDLTPNHILVTHNNTYKLAQNSVLRVLRTNREMRVGTPRYTAPEILKGESYSYPVDVFMFGLIMYESMTGRHPFENSSGNIDIARFITCDYQKITKTSYHPELIELCHSMLSLNPSSRPTIPQILHKRILPRVVDDSKKEVIELKKKLAEMEKENKQFKMKLGIPTEDEKVGKHKASSSSSSSSSFPTPERKYDDTPMNQEEKITFVRNTADHGVVGRGAYLEFTKDNYYSYFVNKKIVEGIYRIEIEGTLANIAEGEFAIGLSSKQVLPNIFDSHIKKFKSSCCLESSLDSTVLYTGTIANDYLTIPIQATTTFVMEVNIAGGGMLYFYVDEEQLGIQVVNVPRGVYFGMSGRVGSQYEVRSLRRIASPTVDPKLAYEVYEWVEGE